MKSLFNMRISFLVSLLFVNHMVCAKDVIEIIGIPTQSDSRAVSEELTAAYSYKGLNPTEAMGITGFSVGAMGSYTGVENKQAFKDLTGENVDFLGMVGAAANKGLPLGFDVGAYYNIAPETNIKSYGGNVRWSYLDGNAVLPAVGVRLAATKLVGIDSFDLTTYSADVSISKGFLFITPYIGAGQVRGISDPHGYPTLQKETVNHNKVFGGARITLGLLELTAEADKTGDNLSYNLMLGLGF